MPVVEIDKENFEPEVLNSTLPVVIDFWGPMCQPCIALMPKYHVLADEPKYAGKVKFCSLDTTKNRRIAVSLKVMAQPAFLFWRGGKVIGRLSGSNLDMEAVAAKIEEVCAE